jgi:anthranilate synthase component 1
MSLTKEEFRRNRGLGRIIPIHKTVNIKGLSPDLAWRRLCSEQRHSFLLESIEGEEKLARYSFLGWDPLLIYRSKGNRIEIHSGSSRNVVESEPIKALKELVTAFRYPQEKGLPRFPGGAVGYLGYDAVRFFENLPDENPDDLELPECCFIFPRTVLAFDHKEGLLTIVLNVRERSRETTGGAMQEIEKIISQLKKLNSRESGVALSPKSEQRIESNFTQSKFEEIVERAKEYIRAGDIFQVVLSHRMSIDFAADPFEVYRILRVTNPSPYMYYLNFDDRKVVGSSPEVLVRVTDGMVETRPLAGTRPRGASPAEDQALMEELLADEKERAEHIMLVDLGRNDIGRVCQYGSVRVTELLGVEKYSHVMHLVSNVVGKLKQGKDGFDVLRATFPAGTVSGAPKIRAMEIIDELETSRRGIYAGAVGYVSSTGNLDTCIAIRTILFTDAKAYIQAGAGIVADSIPQREYRETLEKARALIGAVEHAAAAHR